jgi:hypothetical protein
MTATNLWYYDRHPIWTDVPTRTLARLTRDLRRRGSISTARERGARHDVRRRLPARGWTRRWNENMTGIILPLPTVRGTMGTLDVQDENARGRDRLSFRHGTVGGSVRGCQRLPDRNCGLNNLVAEYSKTAKFLFEGLFRITAHQNDNRDCRNGSGLDCVRLYWYPVNSPQDTPLCSSCVGILVIFQ